MTEENKRRLPREMEALEGPKQIRHIVALLVGIVAIVVLGIAVWQYFEARFQKEEVSLFATEETNTTSSSTPVETFENAIQEDLIGEEDAANDKGEKGEDMVMAEGLEKDPLVNIYQSMEENTDGYGTPSPSEKAVASHQTESPLSSTPPTPKENDLCPAKKMLFLITVDDNVIIDADAVNTLDFPVVFALDPLDATFGKNVNLVRETENDFVLDLDMPKPQQKTNTPDTEKHIIRTLKRNLHATSGYGALKNKKGEFFGHDATLLTPFFKEVKETHLPFIGHGLQKGVSEAFLKKAGVPYFAITVDVGQSTAPGDVKKRLDAAFKECQKNGFVIVSLPWKDTILQALRTWVLAHPDAQQLMVPLDCLFDK